MMRRRVVLPALLLAALGAAPSFAAAQYGAPVPVADASQRFSAQQLDNLVGPVALYPDALLAQVLVAATFPDQIEDAAEFVRKYGTDSIDVQSWDISVKAVAHYPSALNAMNDKIDWTAALGKAYAIQSSDVMASVQRLRKMAADQGNLNSTPQQNVVRAADTYQIVPVEPRVIYVPVYDPYIIYSRPIFNVGFSSRYWSFGVGFPIGSWLIYDCDWGMRRVYYNGWSPTYYSFGGGWRQRSRPFIHITNIYVSPRYANVYVNRNVIRHSVNYYNIDRYGSVHRGPHFNSRNDGRYDSRDDGRNRTRYAQRNDGDNRGGAVNGRGYTNGNPRSDEQVNRSDDDRRSNSPRGNVPRDGSGYSNNDGNRGNDGNRANDGNRNGRNDGNRDGVRDDGNRGRQDGANGNSRAIPPQERRSEPVARSENQPQVFVPERRSEPNGRPDDQPRVFTPQRRAQPDAQQRTAPEPRMAEPRSAQPRMEQPRMEQPRMERPRDVQPRIEQRAPQPQVARPDRGRGNDSRSEAAPARSARPRGGN